MAGTNAGANAQERRAGVGAALSAYGIWGLFPLLFRMLDGVGPITIVANRIVWSFLLVGALLLRGRGFAEVRGVFSSARAVRGLVISAVLLSVNWLTFVWAVETDKVLEVSFGYFINPLVSIGIGMILLSERMNRMQGLAITVAVIAVGVQALGLSGVPVVSLTLAFTFGFYGYFRKTVPAGSAAGLFIETLVLLPLALGYLAFTLLTEGPGPYGDPWLVFWLLMTGPATSGALLLFAYGARRLPLSMMGMFQYIAPSMHFLLAIFIFGEPLNGTQLFSFVLIWLSLIIYSADGWRRRPRRSKTPPPDPESLGAFQEDTAVASDMASKPAG